MSRELAETKEARSAAGAAFRLTWKSPRET